MTNIGFACTTLSPDSDALIKNTKIWETNKIGAIAIALDRKSSKANKLASHCIPFENQPQSRYERLCPWDSYSRKNIAFIALKREGVSHIFETDDDNELMFDGKQLLDLFDGSFNSLDVCKKSSSNNIFKDIYDDMATNIWARGFPIEWLDSDDRFFRKSGSLKECNGVGVVQFLVDGNPDVDAILRLVHGNQIALKANENHLPIVIYDSYHPFNSQATLWQKEEFPLMYLPSSCEFRMTDIWRGYIAQNALYAKHKCVAFSSSIVYQDRNQHVISSDFFGEHKGYLQSKQVIQALAGLELNKELSYSSILRLSYEALVGIGIFDKSELVLLDAWLEDIQ